MKKFENDRNQTENSPLNRAIILDELRKKEPTKEVHFNISICEQGLGNVTQAISAISESINKDSSFLTAYYQRGYYYTLENLFYEALKDYLHCFKVLESINALKYGNCLEFHIAEVAFNIAYCLGKLGKHNQATDYAHLALNYSHFTVTSLDRSRIISLVEIGTTNYKSNPFSFPFVLFDLENLSKKEETENIELPSNIVDLAKFRATFQRDAIFFNDHSLGLNITYGAFFKMAARAAQRISSLHDVQKPMVALITGTSPVAYVSIMSIWLLGWELVLLNPSTPLVMLKRQIRAMAPTLLITISDIEKTAKELGESFNLPFLLLSEDTSVELDFSNVVHPLQITETLNFIFPVISPNQPAVWIHSSSSKDKNSLKIIQLTHRQLFLGCLINDTLTPDIGESDSLLAWTPITHAIGFYKDFLAFGLYKQVIINFRPSRKSPPIAGLLLEDLNEIKPTICHTVPWFLKELKLLLEDGRGLNLNPCFRYFFVGGSPLSEKIRRYYKSRGIRILCELGSTETGTIMAGNTYSEDGGEWMRATQYHSIKINKWDGAFHENAGILIVGGDAVSKVKVVGDSGNRLSARESSQKLLDTGDLFEIRVNNEITEYRFISRVDGLLMLDSGVSVNPTPLIDQFSNILKTEDIFITIFNERFYVVIKRDEKQYLDENEFQDLKNIVADSSGNDLQLTAEMIIFLDKNDVMERGSKRNILPAQLHQLLEAKMQQRSTIQKTTSETIFPTQNDSEEFLSASIIKSLEMVNIHITVEQFDIGFSYLGLTSLLVVPFLQNLSTIVGREISVLTLYNASTPHLLLNTFRMPDNLSIPKSVYSESSGLVDEFAIVGVGCRFPKGIESLEEFWDAISFGKDLYNSPGELNPKRTTLSKLADNFRGAFLDAKHSDYFDCNAFGISPMEAAVMDPQHRCMLESTWCAFEDGLIPFGSLKGSKTSVFASAVDKGWHMRLNYYFDGKNYSRYSATGSDFSSASNRISHFFGFTGPSIAISTACSSSIALLKLSFDSFRDVHQQYSVVSACSLHSWDGAESILEKAGVRSKAIGRCASFDKRADGFVGSEAALSFVIRRKIDAIRDGNRIHGIIKGASLIHNGGESLGIGAPFGKRQVDAMRDALATSKVTQNDIQFVEAHATGTLVGDPIEAKSLTEVFACRDQSIPPLMVGACKSNLGHTEVASGLTAIAKIIVSMKNGGVAPTFLEKHNMNPKVTELFEKIPAVIPIGMQPTEWPATPTRTGLVFAAGLTGSVGAAVIQSPPANLQVMSAQMNSILILGLSAQSKSSLIQLIDRYIIYLKDVTDEEGYRICYAANMKRSNLSYRIAVSGNSVTDLISNLKKTKEKAEVKRTVTKHPPVVFVCPGQGKLDPAIAERVYRKEPFFEKAFNECVECASLLGYADSINFHNAKPEYDQVNLFAIQYSLAYLCRKSYKLEPAVVIGHSFGEIVAACLCGLFTLAEAIKFVLFRGITLEQKSCQGKMVSIFCSETELAKLDLEKDSISIAAYNGENHIVISGTIDNVENFLKRVPFKNIALNNRIAFHSSVVQESALQLNQFFAETPTESNTLKVNMASTVEGGLKYVNDVITPGYWSRHARGSVKFVQAYNSLRKEYPNALCIELGPGILKSTIVRIDPKAVFLSTLPDFDIFLTSLYPILPDFDWGLIYGEEIVPLPTNPLPLYPFDRTEVKPPPQIRNNPKPIDSNDIAIVGVGVKLPKNVETLNQFWSRFHGEFTVTKTLPEDRPQVLYPGYTPRKFELLEDLFSADESFFNEFNQNLKVDPFFLAPHIRSIIEVTVHALERAGISLDEVKKLKTGIFTTSPICVYSFLVACQKVQIISKSEGNFDYRHKLASVALAEFLGVSGPLGNFADGSCEMGALSIKAACDQLRLNECDIAIASSSSCFFDSSILEAYNLYNSVESAFSFILKRESDAIRDGDRILGVIESFAVGYSENPHDIVETALRQSNNNPEDFQYFGSYVDESELPGFRIPRIVTDCERAIPIIEGKCPDLLKGVTPTKAFIGILAVIEGMLKNQYPDSKAQQWVSGDKDKKALVFFKGMSGAAYSVSLRAAPELPKPIRILSEDLNFLLVFSAKSKQSLSLLKLCYVKLLLDVKSSEDLYDICVSASLERAHYNYRIAVIGKDASEIIQQLMFSSETSYPSSYSSIEIEEPKELWNDGNSIFGSIETVQDILRISGFKLLSLENGNLLLQLENRGFNTLMMKSEFQSSPEAALGYLYTAGVNINWKGVLQPNFVHVKAELPVYQFVRSPLKPPTPAALDQSNAACQTFELNLDNLPYLRDHKLKKSQQIILPGAYLALVASSLSNFKHRITIQFSSTLGINENQSNMFTIHLGEDGAYRIHDGSKDTSHFKQLGVNEQNWTLMDIDIVNQLDICRRIGDNMNINAYYSHSITSAIDFGPSFRRVKEIWKIEDTAFAIVSFEAASEAFPIHPTCLDACLHFMAPLHDVPVLPIAFEDFSINPILLDGTFKCTEFFCRNTKIPQPDPQLIVSRLEIFDRGTGKCIASIGKIVCKILNQSNSIPLSNTVWAPITDSDIEKNSLRNTLETFWVLIGKKSDSLFVELNRTLKNSVCILLDGEVDLEISAKILIPWKLLESQYGQLNIVLCSNFSAFSECPYSDWYHQSGVAGLLVVIKEVMKNAPKLRPFVTVVVTEGDRSYTQSPAIGAAKTIAAELKWPTKILNFDIDCSLKFCCDQITNLSSVTFNEISILPNYTHLKHIKDSWNIENRQNFTRVDRQKPKRGIYFITGGVGGFAMALTRYLLSEQIASKIILLGRRKADTVVQELSSFDNSVITYISADVSDSQSIAKTIKGIAIAGIVHCAGVLRDGAITSATAEAISEVGMPKIGGALAIMKAFQIIGEKLPPIVYCSSVASALGNPGQLAYTMANSALDSLAINSSATTTHESKMRSIQFGAIEGTGMATNLPEFIRKKVHISLIHAIEAVCAAFSYKNFPPCVLAANVDWNSFIAKKTIDDSKESTENNDESKNLETKLIPVDSVRSVDSVRAFLESTLTDQIGVETFEDNVSLGEMGVDSIAVVGIKSAVQEQFNIVLDVNEIANFTLVTLLDKILNA